MAVIPQSAIQSVLRRYDEPHRHYHTRLHIQELLKLFGLIRPTLQNPDAVEIAIYWHDAVYDPEINDNEARSVLLMESDLSLAVNEKTIDYARILINATANHQIPKDADPSIGNDCAFFLDMDMAILGSSRNRYNEYAASIRMEYKPVFGDRVYDERRGKFLQTLQDTKPLFRTKLFQGQLALAARRNIRRELAHIYFNA